jgi:heat shock protein HslJ
VTRPALVAAVVLAAGCGTGEAGREEPPPPPPTGSWQLVDGIDPVPDRRITLVLEGDRVGGVAACNSYGGALVVERDRFAVRSLSQTEMGCEPAAMAAEAAYLDALGQVETFAREREALVLSGPSVELRFEPTAPVPTRELLETVWTLDTVIRGDVASSVTGPATLRLGRDGRLEGGTGCRAFRGRYVLAGDEVRVTELAAEAAGACAPAVAEQDRLVVEVLGDAFRAAVEGDRLTVAAGADTLVYRAS